VTANLGAPPPELEAAFDRLEAAGVVWCVLRLPPDPGKSGGDIDLLVALEHVPRLRAILIDRGFVELPGWRTGLHFLAYSRLADRWLWLHVVTELTFGALSAVQTQAEAGCLSRREYSRRYPTPAPDDAFWILLMHCVLDKGFIAQRHRAQLIEYATQAHPDGPIAQCFGAICPPAWTPSRVLATISREDWTDVERIVPTLWQAAVRRGRAAGMQRRFVSAWNILQRLRCLPRQRGLSVALLGPDGAGKSTLMAGIQHSFIFPVRPMYMGLTGGLLPTVNRLRVPPLVVLIRLVIFWSRYLIAQYHQARGRLVVFDRYTYDADVPTPFPLTRIGRMYRRIDRHACPSPDLVLLLDAPGSVMYARKGEYDPVTLEDWRGHFLALRERISRLEVLDATQSPECVRGAAIERIWRRYTARWQPNCRAT
jgi:thymidylate kinase